MNELPGSLGQFLVLAPAPLVIAFRRAKHRQKRQGPNRRCPGNLDQQHTRQPAQSAGFDKVRFRGAHRIVINAFGADLVSAPPLQRVIEAKQQGAPRSKGPDQQPQQNTTESQRRPLRAIEHAMVILKMRIITLAHDTQAGGHGAFAESQNRADQQDLRMFPNRLGKIRLKLYYKWQQLDRQCLHIEDTFLRKICLQLTPPVVSFSMIKTPESMDKVQLSFYKIFNAKDAKTAKKDSTPRTPSRPRDLNESYMISIFDCAISEMDNTANHHFL